MFVLAACSACRHSTCRRVLYMCACTWERPACRCICTHGGGPSCAAGQPHTQHSKGCCWGACWWAHCTGRAAPTSTIHTCSCCCSFAYHFSVIPEGPWQSQPGVCVLPTPVHRQATPTLCSCLPTSYRPPEPERCIVCAVLPCRSRLRPEECHAWCSVKGAAAVVVPSKCTGLLPLPAPPTVEAAQAPVHGVGRVYRPGSSFTIRLQVLVKGPCVWTARVTATAV
jgi:hypothetical protein